MLGLADNLRKYASYLDEQVVITQTSHARKMARTDVDEWQLYHAMNILPTKRAKYKTLHEALQNAYSYEAIFINDFAPADRRRRYEYMAGLVFPVKCIVYSHTALQNHLHFVWKLGIADDDGVRQKKNDETKDKLKSQFPVYHSRAMRRDFISTFGRVTGVKSAFLREAYRRLTGDSAATRNMSEQEVDSRIQQVLEHEDPEILWDLRVNNTGRPEGYSIFLQKCQDFIKGKVETAVDDRRHDNVTNNGESVVHLAMAMSARDLHEQVKKQCPEGTPIPSIQWLRLQFWPNKACAASNKHTGRLKVKMVVAARQFRKSHVGVHYASAVFRYQKEFCVKFRAFTSLVCEDDKHTIKVGQTGFPVAAVERGRRVIVGLNQSFQVGDHDFTKFSLSPFVSLVVDIPDSIDGSFYDGQVYVGLKDNVFEPSSALRHACELKSCLNTSDQNSPVEGHYHDGGSDHNLRFLRTQLSQVAYFLQQDLDMLMLVQTPPQHLWKNPTERVMSNLNLALQGIGVMRTETATQEGPLKQANNLKKIRKLAKKYPSIQDEISDSLQQPKILLGSPFKRCQLKGKNFQVFTAATKKMR